MIPSTLEALKFTEKTLLNSVHKLYEIQTEMTQGREGYFLVEKLTNELEEELSKVWKSIEKQEGEQGALKSLFMEERFSQKRLFWLYCINGVLLGIALDIKSLEGIAGYLAFIFFIFICFAEERAVRKSNKLRSLLWD